VDSDSSPVAPGSPSPAAGTTALLTFDPARVRWPEWVVGVSALVLLVAMFALDWYTTAVGPGISESVTGWNGVSHLRWLILVTIVAGLALLILQATRRPPALPVTLSLLVTFLGGFTVIWLFVRVVVDPPAGRAVGGWVGLAAATVLAWGAFRSLAMEGISPKDAPAEIPTVTLPATESAPVSASADSPPSADRS
jgi:hypothetical protein